MDIRKQMDDIYRDMPPDKIPWNISEPPKLLIDAVESGKIKPCKTIDLGCGAGNYSIWLVRQGFDVTGTDISKNAIIKAKSLADENDVNVEFIVFNLLGDLSQLYGKFEFALDWELLHHIFPEDREKYIDNVYKLLKPGGKYLSLGFSEDDPAFGGKGKYRDTPLGTKLYFSSESELRELYVSKFKIIELTTVEIPGKFGSHIVIASWLEKV